MKNPTACLFKSEFFSGLALSLLVDSLLCGKMALLSSHFYRGKMALLSSHFYRGKMNLFSVHFYRGITCPAGPAGH
jgi:hypothetical protein